MSRACAACNKTVYPTEELRCLEKLWHKSCFRCQECNKVLTVQNFKGFGGKPYCYAHYPHLKSVGEVTNTPEMQQVAMNTKNMSKVMYHRDYESLKGKQSSLYESPRAFDKDIDSSQTIETPLMANKQLQQVHQISGGYTRNSPPGSSWDVDSYHQPQSIKTATNSNRTSNFSNNGNENYSQGYRNDQSNGNGNSGNRLQEVDDAVPIYRPDLVMMGGMKVTGSGMHFQAVYNYEAAEDDEVSFIEGDEILHGEPIDEGWMFGTVRRTGQFGMLPSNYVVPIQTTSLRN
nr:LIM and SH3 domain protein 1 [Hymenolepis microstoma]